jgi:outer membrane protein assembly factor BamB
MIPLERTWVRRDGRIGLILWLALAAAAAFVVVLLVWHFQARPGDQSAATPDRNTPTPQTRPAPAPQTPVDRQWPQFRGPGGQGVARNTNLPVQWDGTSGEGILWTVDVPAPGYSSPIVWEDRLFLTGSNGQDYEVYCYDARTGKLLWTRPVAPGGEATMTPQVFEGDTGIFAAATAVTDGRRVCAIFANGDIGCFDFDGKELWSHALGPFNNMYGYASSLAVEDGRVIVQMDQSTPNERLSAVEAYDIASGKRLWREGRPVAASWSSPIVAKPGKRKIVVAAAPPFLMAHDFDTGKEVWRVDCIWDDQAPSPTAGGAMVFAAASGGPLYAIRPGGQGNVTESHVAWEGDDGVSDISSPATDGRYVYVAYYGLTCYEAETGKKLWQIETDDPCEATPIIAGDRVYALDTTGVMTIYQAGPEKEEPLARCPLGEGLSCRATPAFADGRIYIRAKVEVEEYARPQQRLYCIGRKAD